MRRIILWDYERGTWQYDLLVGLIIATVFLAPSSFFGERDRPKVHLPRAQQEKATRRANESAASASYAAAGQREGLEVTVADLNRFRQEQSLEAGDNPQAALALYLRKQLQRDGRLDRYEVQLDEAGQPVSYRVWMK